MDQVRAFAQHAHGEQTYGDAPYVVHLDAVVGVLREFGYSAPAVLSAGFLHDVLEDTEVAYDTLAARFGADVAQMAAFCTDEEGPNRKARKAQTYARMREALNAALEGEEGDREVMLGAAAVKLADRLANVRACVAQDNARLLSMYRREHDALRGALFVEGAHAALWCALDAALAA